jgi:hypothetical protein
MVASTMVRFAAFVVLISALAASASRCNNTDTVAQVEGDLAVINVQAVRAFLHMSPSPSIFIPNSRLPLSM